MRTLPKPLRFLASIQLGVVILVALAVLTTVGTIVEARYDAEIAGKLVYHSWWMYVIKAALAICLIAVMVDRWPWKRHHTGFVLAHIGILVLLVGAWITQRFGIDGSMIFEIGQDRKFVAVKNKDIQVYGSIGDTEVRGLFGQEVDFITRPPSEAEPYRISLGAESIEVVEYIHFAFRESEMRISDKAKDGPAIRFQLQNPNVNMIEWLRQDSFRPFGQTDLGPAKVVLTRGEYSPSGRNEIVVRPLEKSDRLSVTIYDKDKNKRLSRIVRQGEALETGWMGLQFRMLRYLPRAQEIVRYSAAEASSPLARPAIRLKFNGESYWLGLNSLIRLYKDQQMFIVSYGQRQIELPFALRLLEFKMDTYQGTQRAMSYESVVEVPDRGTVTISMNEPLDHGGFTFYQSSFEQDPMGKPIASILSVNYDPGRLVKYLGSLLIVVGSIVLFYFKRLEWRKRGRHGVQS